LVGSHKREGWISRHFSISSSSKKRDSNPQSPWHTATHYHCATLPTMLPTLHLSVDLTIMVELQCLCAWCAIWRSAMQSTLRGMTFNKGDQTMLGRVPQKRGLGILAFFNFKQQQKRDSNPQFPLAYRNPLPLRCLCGWCAIQRSAVQSTFRGHDIQ
jgi:hypothetical protein